MLVKKCCLEFF